MTHAHLLGSAGFIPGAGLPLTDRAFRYGMSVFETIAIRDGSPLLLDPHLVRLRETVAIACFHPRAGWCELVRERLLPPPVEEGVARVYVTAGDHDGGESRVALLFESMVIPSAMSAARAETVAFSPATPFGKTGNYWPHFLARPASGDEAILCAPDGALLGGAMANVFLIGGGRLLTPREPLRRGIVRDWMLSHFDVAEEPLTRGDFATVSAAFLTNSRLGVCRLTAIDGRDLPGDPLVETAWQSYRTEVLRVR
ncbi:MAG: aminotransferase class IV [Terrimicrobiaceae bacterium]|nr:aminotransferase class IV [Terrimicrobiaceae bacterium]